MQLPVPPSHVPYRFLIPIQNVLFGEEPQAVHQGDFPIAFLWEEGTVRSTVYGTHCVGQGDREERGHLTLGMGRERSQKGSKAVEQ